MLLECDDGTFGTNCRILCGHCHKGQSCDKETGACPRGCEPGYEGIYCNKSKIALTLFCVFFYFIFSTLFKHCCLSLRIYSFQHIGSEFE